MALIHILDKQQEEIKVTLNHSKGEFWESIRKDTLNNHDTFDFIVNAKSDKSTLLTKRNRVVIQDEDGFFREYRIVYAEQYKRGEKLVKANASYTDLAKAKVIEPQTLQGATSATAADTALQGTKWQAGIIEYAGIRSITIEEYTNPLALLRKIASEFGSELRFRVVVDGNRITGRFVDLVQPVTDFDGTEVEFGKNLIGLRRKEDSLNIVTALLGVGPEREDGTRLTVLVENQEALQRWGENGQHLIEPYFPESSDPDMTLERLTTLTENELEKRVDALVSYEAELAATDHIHGRAHEKVRTGKTIRIKDTGYKPPLYLEARVQEIERDYVTKKILKSVIGNFIEYKKEDLERQVSVLKGLLKQKASSAKLTEAITLAAQQAEQAESNAKQYADTQDVGVYQDATLYTDQRAGQIESDVSGLTTRVTSTESQLTVQSEQIASRVTKTEFEGLQIGGRNLVVYKNLTPASSGTFTADSKTGLISGKQANWYIKLPNAGLKPNTEYIVSNKYFQNTGSDHEGYLTINIYNQELNSQKQYVGSLESGKSIFFTTLSNILETDAFLIYPTNNTRIDYTIDSIKLEKGNKATDWTPSPEDVDAAISGLNGRLTTAESTITQQADQISQKVSETDYNGNTIASLINQTSTEILIQAAKILLDGFVEAKHIKATGLLFDVLKGGLMTLGGPNNGNGRMQVLNEDGEVIVDLDAGKGGADELFIGKVKSPSIINVNTGTLSLYVDPVNGSDEYAGLSWAYPKKTIQSALDSCPKYNNGAINIYCHYDNARNMYEQVRIDGFIGSGFINIDAQNAANTIAGDVTVSGTSNRVFVKNFTINSTRGMGVEVYNSAYVQANNVRVYGQNGGRCFYAEFGGVLRVTNCQGWDAAIICYAKDLGRIYVQNTVGLGSNRGVAAQDGGEVRLSGNYPNGSVSATYSDSGGNIIGAGSTNSGTKGTVPPVQSTKQISTSTGNNWSESYAAWTNDGVKQGSYGYGNRRGAWFFGTSILDTIGTGKTIKAMRVWIKRESKGGSSGAVRHSLRGHGHTSQPAGAPALGNEMAAISLGWGQSAWVNIPSSWWGYFANGTYRGIGLYSSDGSNYSICSTECIVEITYQ